MNNAGMLILNNLPWFWIAVMIVCIIIESFTLTLTTLWFACGAFVTIFISMTPLPFRWQVLIFAVLSCVLLVLTRPLLLKKMRERRESKTNVDAIIGQKVLVTKAITQFDKGEVKCSGTYWPAESKDGSKLPAGSVCRILSIQGNTVTVEAVEN
jgi:membrane protein implicated in regulation of membrane protease activity